MDILKNKTYNKLSTKIYFDIKSGKVSDAEIEKAFKILFPNQYKIGQLSQILSYANKIKLNIVSLDEFQLEINKYYKDKILYNLRKKKLK